MSFLLTEGRERVGGNITTCTNEEGYLWEEGPNSFQPSDAMLKAAVRAALLHAQSCIYVCAPGRAFTSAMQAVLAVLVAAWCWCRQLVEPTTFPIPPLHITLHKRQQNTRVYCTGGRGHQQRAWWWATP